MTGLDPDLGLQDGFDYRGTTRKFEDPQYP